MKGIKRYFGKLFRLAYSVRRLPLDLSFLDFFFYPLTSLPSVVWAYLRQENVGTVMDKMIQDNRLKHILNANIGYFHDDPYTFCWYFHAAAQASYYNASVYIKGGSQVLSNQLVDIIKANGGDVICNAMVEKITVEKSTATGVLYKKKGASEVLEQKASAIIANCAPQNVFKEMLPPEYAEPWAEKLECAPSLCTVYIIFKKKFISLYPHNSYSTFIQTEKTMDKPISTLFEQHKNQPIEERVFIFVDYSTIDSGLVNKDDERSFAVLTVVSYLNEWEHLSKDEYTAKKEDLARKLFQRVEKLYPGFIENIEYYEVSTPKTIQRYIGTPGGSAYGFKQNRFLQKSRAPRKAKKVKNLYFASAWNFPGGGFTGVIVTGYMAAIGILRPVIPLVIARLIVCVAASFAVMQGIGLLLRILK